MASFGHGSEQQALKLAERRGIDISADTQNGLWYPKIAKLDARGATEQHITSTGADYLFSQIDLFSATSSRLRASRMISTVMARNRTELAYWTRRAPTQKLEVHKGAGKLILGNPRTGGINIALLDTESSPTVTLPSERFYTIEALLRSDELVVSVISSRYDTSPPVDWNAVEIPFEPGQQTVVAPEGTVEIPLGFYRAAHENGSYGS